MDPVGNAGPTKPAAIVEQARGKIHADSQLGKRLSLSSPPGTSSTGGLFRTHAAALAVPPPGEYPRAMPEHANAALARGLFDALANRDAAVVQAAIAEDAVWRFPGRHGQLAGEHRGREAILGFLGKVMVLTAGTFSLEIEDVTASDENVVVLFTGAGERNGRTLTNPTALRIRIEDGRAVEFTEFVWDLEHVEEFWS